MQRNDSSESSQQYHRSCNQKIQNDSIKSPHQSKNIFRLARSQNEIDRIEGQEEMDQIEKEWQRKEHDHKNSINQKQTPQSNENKKKQTQEENIRIRQQNLHKGLEFGASIVDSEQISMDEEVIGKPIQFQVNRQNESNGEELKILVQRLKKQSLKPVPIQTIQLRLNILLLGKSGTGKSSFIDCFTNKKYETIPLLREKTEILTTHIISKQSGHVKLDIGLIDLPGYRETQVDAYIKQTEKLVTGYMDKHIEAQDNNQKKGLLFPDERVHCCLFFLSGPWISDYDLQIMQKMSAITNLIPIIAKSDTYTLNEIKQFKKRIVERSKIQNVNWFSIEQILRQNYPQKLTLLLEGNFGRSPPFVITCCTQKQYNQINRKYEMVRDYKWGKCELNNQTYNDFKFLKELLISYLSDILNRSTDILERSYTMRKMSESRKSVKSQEVQEEAEDMRNMRTSINEQQIVSAEDEWGVMRYLAIGMTIVGTIATVFWIKNHKTA